MNPYIAFAIGFAAFPVLAASIIVVYGFLKGDMMDKDFILPGPPPRY